MGHRINVIIPLYLICHPFIRGPSLRAQVTVLLSEERRLCLTVLADVAGMRPDAMFQQLLAATPVVQDALATLASQAQALALLPRTPEKIFSFLDLYRCVHELAGQVREGAGGGVRSLSVWRATVCVLQTKGLSQTPLLGLYRSVSL